MDISHYYVRFSGHKVNWLIEIADELIMGKICFLMFWLFLFYCMCFILKKSREKVRAFWRLEIINVSIGYYVYVVF